MLKQTGRSLYHPASAPGQSARAGSGTVFRVFFPSAEAPEPVTPATGDEEAGGLPRGGETVLLVEDDAAGYQVLAAEDARSAIELCDTLEGDLDLLLTDVVMPETSGPVLAEDLQRRYSDLKVLFMSGYTDSNTGVRLLNERRASFLPKPFSPEVLAHKVREVLDGGHKPSQ